MKNMINKERPEKLLSEQNVTPADLARLIGKAPGTPLQWTEHLGLPRRPDGTYNLQTALHWITNYYEKLRMPPLALSEVSQEQLASLLGFSRQTVWQWQKEGLPQNENGTFDLRIALRWIGPHYQRHYQEEYEKRLQELQNKET